MWCPKCKNEYVPGITKCADCGVELVESLEDETRDVFPEQTIAENSTDDGDIAIDENASVSPVSSAHAYVSKKTKTEDLKSTAYTFTIVGGIGLIALLLFIFDVLPLLVAPYMKVMISLVMGTLFLIFIIVGIRSFGQLKASATEADEEENLLTEILDWFRSTHTKESIDANLDLNEKEETLYFSRYEVMKNLILEKYESIDDSLLDHIIETLYAELF